MCSDDTVDTVRGHKAISLENKPTGIDLKRSLVLTLLVDYCLCHHLLCSRVILIAPYNINTFVSPLSPITLSYL